MNRNLFVSVMLQKNGLIKQRLERKKGATEGKLFSYQPESQ